MPAMASSPSTLRATYASPSDNDKAFTREIAPTPDKTAFLAALRTSVTELQAEVNAFVTQKMDDDKKAAGIDDKNDAALEENYGEENVQED
ncbi:uncharacterized protein K452DRAFT_318917 [Aplosporella prunicola CBS 121167]|uniref:EKC/KEOPS complex subunit GON7 n=1 Tax=Aplosporella prunicola CBS 121167 TaxID=1176127 RepID=A0A6A6BD94_9PEZI|nr:uncharacterized protein K452DRAFT_318917 [Aplosporella prunicola CBS 121167]KAF2141265.1 hypothetical protein K452DRAFT_318917 [Aplosporella prunicola CBS 121167]